MSTTLSEVKNAFQEKFSGQPLLIFSPGRINLIGEHIDYNNGFVMPAAISKGIWFAIAPNGTDHIRFISVDMQEYYETKVSEIHKEDSWKNYVLGVVHILQQHQKNVQGFDCAFGGNLPVGAGLSSSAAVEGGLLFGLNKIFALNLNRVEMAKIAQEAEHSYPGVNCGIMDQFASINGKKDHVILLDCDTLAYEYLPLDLSSYKIVLINSKVHHSLSSGEYNIRRQQCEKGLEEIKRLSDKQLDSFRQISSTYLKTLQKELEPKIYDRCLYVTEEIERTQQAAILLKQNNLKAFGKLMFLTHEGLSKLYEVSCKELDFLFGEIRRYDDVIGSRMMGGGFGGCTINIIKTEKVSEITEKVLEAYQKEWNITGEAYVMDTSDGTFETK